jgi:hypothetical protein
LGGYAVVLLLTLLGCLGYLLAVLFFGAIAIVAGALLCRIGWGVWRRVSGQKAREERALVEVLMGLRCRRCGAAFGSKVAEAACAAYQVQPKHEKFWVEVVYAPWWPVRCGECGFRDDFDYSNERMQVDVPLDDQTQKAKA